MAVMGLRLAGRVQRRRQAPRRGQPRDVRRPVARRAHRRGADQVDHQRRARRRPGCRRRWPTCSTRHVLPEWDEAGRRPLGPHPRRARRRAVAGPRAGPRAHGGVRPPAAARVAHGARASRRPTWRGATRCSTRSALTICFARRFATYKRATLLLSQPERLKALLLDGDRPVQFVFAGKAHPADDSGKEHDPGQIVRVRRRPRGAPPLRVPRGLRHRRRPGPLPGRRRVAQQPPPPAGGVRHVGHEGGAQRRPQLLDPRRLVGRVLRRRERLGDHVGRARSTTTSGATRSRPHSSSSCSSARSSRCSTTGGGGSPRGLAARR